jgi:16S rRNA processing protein RimM
VRVRIGKVGRPHGIDGAFFVEQPSDDGRWWKTGATFLADGAPVEVIAHRRSSGRPVIKLDRPVDRGAALEVDRDALPPTAEDEYYAFELAGLPVVEENGRALGSVKVVTPGVANDVLELDSGVLLPMVEECILKVDLEAGRITVADGFAE